jgi:hypothetical protein
MKVDLTMERLNTKGKCIAIIHGMLFQSWLVISQAAQSAVERAAPNNSLHGLDAILIAPPLFGPPAVCRNLQDRILVSICTSD